MGISPLTVAAVAGALLIISVVADLAFSQSVSVEAGKAGETLVLVGQGSPDGRQASPISQSDPIEVNRSDMLTLRVRLDNGHPWTSTRSFTLTTDGCYQGARTLAIVDVSAPARGVGTGSVDLNVGKLLNATGNRLKPMGGEFQGVYFTLCSGETSVVYASLSITEVPS